MAKDRDRFFVKCERDDNGCLIWTGSLSTTGYGRFWANGKLWLAHRWSYTEFVGPIPDGLVLDHFFCNEPTCVEPSHLEPVTQQTNVKRFVALRTRCRFGHDYTPETAFATGTGQLICPECWYGPTRKPYAH